jgi:hypothetical protein
VKTGHSTLRGEQSTAIPVITWDDFKAQLASLWQRFCSKIKTNPPKEKTKPAKENAPSTIKPVQIYSPAILFYFIERGRRSYEKGISFTHWSDRMIIVHGGAVIPYLREAWEYVKARTFPAATDDRQKGANHVNGNGVNGRTKDKDHWKTSSIKLHWRTFAGGIVAGSLLCMGFFFAFTSHPKNISTGDAKNHVGESAVVVGTVSEIHVTPKGTVLIDMDGSFPSEQFTAVWFAPGAPVAQLQNFGSKTISVKGIIQEYRGRPEIILTTLSQISN